MIVIRAETIGRLFDQLFDTKIICNCFPCLIVLAIFQAEIEKK